MPRQFGLYKLFLKLYPRSFQKEYSEPMIQTLADMLNGQPDKNSRRMVWLRVSAELPLSIAQETMTSLGEKTMDKLSLTRNKRLFAGAAVIVLILASFMLHRWVQKSATPYITGLFYKHSLQAHITQQNNAIGDPFQGLANRQFNNTATCNTSITSGVKTRVECQAFDSAYFKLSQAQADQTRTLQTVKNIESKLAAAGYTAGSNGVTLTSLVSGTYQGKDYSPDAFYEKNIGTTTCVYDTTVAYSNPKQPAINTSLMCSRSIHVFGKISDAVQP